MKQMELNSKQSRIPSFLLEHEQKLLWLLVTLAFLLRLSYTYYAYSTKGTEGWADDWVYLSYGQQIAEGNWSPSYAKGTQFMVSGPAYPMLIAASIRLFGDTYWPIFLYQITITSLLVLVLFYLGNHIFDRRVGWLLALWGVFYADFTYYNTWLVKETTNFFFLPLSLLFLIKSIKEKGTIFSLAMSALSYSWLIHTDERYLVYAPLLALSFFLIRPFRFRQAIGWACMWTVVVMILMVPWTIRNYRVFNQVVLISPRTTAITSKIWGDNIMSYEVLDADEHQVDGRKDYWQAKHQVFYDKYDLKPRRFGRCEKYIRAFINFWQPTYFRPTLIQYGFRFKKWSLPHNLYGLFGYGLFLPFYLAGIILLIKQKKKLGLFIAAIPIIHSLVHTVMVWPLERYRSPVVFCVVCIAIYTICEMYKGIKSPGA